MLRPDGKWNWTIENAQLVLDLGNDYLFQSAFSESRLQADALLTDEGAFTLAQTQAYFSIVEQLEATLAMAKGEIIQAALNYVAALSFAKPLHPKSWFFDSQPHPQAVHAGQVCRLTGQTGESAHYVVLSTDEKTSTLMLLETSHTWSDSKLAKQFSLIRVFNDRIQTAQQQTAKLSKTA